MSRGPERVWYFWEAIQKTWLFSGLRRSVWNAISSLIPKNYHEMFAHEIVSRVTSSNGWFGTHFSPWEFEERQKLKRGTIDSTTVVSLLQELLGEEQYLILAKLDATKSRVIVVQKK